MPRYVGFLRAINVGGRVVKMDRLRALLEAGGLEHVETFIASGNVIWSSPEREGVLVEEAVEKLLESGLGYRVETFVRSPSELAEVLARQPFAGEPVDGHALHVGFLKKNTDESALSALSGDFDAFRVVGREAYWLCQGRLSDSKVSGPKIEKALGGPATFRSITTVRKIAAKWGNE